MATDKNKFFQNIAGLDDVKAKIIWNLSFNAKILERPAPKDVPEGEMAKKLQEAIGDTETMMKVVRMLGNAPGQEAVVQTLYGRSTAKVVKPTPNKGGDAPAKGRPATGNNSGRYSNDPLNPNHFVVVKCANPKRPGSQSHARFAKYKTGLTVQQTLGIKGGPNRGDLQWDRLRGHIEVVAKMPAEEGKATEKPKTYQGKGGVTMPLVGGKKPDETATPTP